MSQGFSSSQWPTAPFSDGGRSQVAEAEALTLEYVPALSPTTACSPQPHQPLPTCETAPWSHMGWSWVLVWDWAHWHCPASIRVPYCFQYAILSNASMATFIWLLQVSPSWFLCPPQLHTPETLEPGSSVELHHGARELQSRHFAWASMCCDSYG